MMRQLLAGLALWPIWGFGQGVVGFGEGWVVLSNSGAPNVVVNGITGEPVTTGSTFQAALYFAADGILDESQFVQVGSAANFGPRPGFFSGGSRSVPTAGPGGFAMFQVRAWETAFGSTYEAAVSNPNPQGGRLALVGKTGIMRVDTANYLDPPTTLVNPSRVVAVTGAALVDGFTLTVVPEPASMILLMLGAVVVLLFRRFR